jgi:putative colanic acid biosynthesis acetyltransferase WcaF
MSNAPVVQRRLADFHPTGYDKGRPVWIQAAWFAAMNLIFSKWWCPARLRVILLRAFGAEVGEGVLIRHRVRVLWPWKLRIGDDAWIGEGVWLLNLEPIDIGHDVCISQEAFLCTGSHKRDSETFDYDNGPITAEPSAWIGARAIVLRGVTVGEGATVAAGSVVSRDVAAGALVPLPGAAPSAEPQAD